MDLESDAFGLQNNQETIDDVMMMFTTGYLCSLYLLSLLCSNISKYKLDNTTRRRELYLFSIYIYLIWSSESMFKKEKSSVKKQMHLNSNTFDAMP